MKKTETLTETLRRVMIESGETHLGMSNATGVTRPSIIRFIRGEQSLHLDAADKLAEHFGLILTPKKTAKRKGK
jgi:plasmid maintenance system antidote protein VapI